MASIMSPSPRAFRPLRPRDRQDFKIAIICALQVESNAVEALFDHLWEDETQYYGKAPGDPNAYTLGMICQHNVVLAYMPGMGKAASASVTPSFRHSFPNIQLGLVVGVCGGAPYTSGGDEVLLGDVIISTGLVQYDFGRHFSNKFVRRDTLVDNLGRPNPEIRGFLAKLQGLLGRRTLQRRLAAYLSEMSKLEGLESCGYPGWDHDQLFPADYRHKHQSPSCQTCLRCTNPNDDICPEALESLCTALGCQSSQAIQRERIKKARNSDAGPEQTASVVQPAIHFGLVASGDWVLKSGVHRDLITAKEHVIAFEMEGSGVWDNFPTVVIKGVCDYADSHKSKQWQPYAAAVAAACTKAFLKEWRSIDQAAPTGEAIDTENYGAWKSSDGQSSSSRKDLEDKFDDQRKVARSANYYGSNDRSQTHTTLSLAREVVTLVEHTVKVNRSFRKFQSTRSRWNLRGLKTGVDQLLGQILKIESLVKSLGWQEAPQPAESENLNAIFAKCATVGLELKDYIKTWRHKCSNEPPRDAKEEEEEEVGSEEDEDKDNVEEKTNGKKENRYAEDDEEGGPSLFMDPDDFIWTEFRQCLGLLRSAVSFCIASSLRRFIDGRNPQPHDRPRSLKEDVETLLRMFTNDNKTIDAVVSGHSVALNKFWAKNISVHPELDPPKKPRAGFWSSSAQKPSGDIVTDEASRQSLDSALDKLESLKRSKVLNSLRYRQMLDREDSVAHANVRTFDWMFDENSNEGQWDDFNKFLRDRVSTRPYWINGKAGSGKSTLMKHLANHHKTRRHLESWAVYKPVVIASFFFWYTGTKMQKSQLGMLQTLLYHILAKYSNLIRVILDDIWPTLQPDESTMPALSFSEAKRAFHKLLHLPQREFDICLFIDGVDEFDGDFLEIAAFIRSLSGPNVKVVVSSRPIPACFDIFGDCPTLRLEHLTRGDIQNFVDGELASHEYMLELMRDEQEEAQSLIQEVSDMSSGVFLWVRLVVRSLLEGLRNGDTITDLRRRLEELPPDLEDLFQHMLDQLEPRDHGQAVQYFEIFREASRITDQPFEALDMYYAEAGPDECLPAAVKALELKTAIKNCRLLEKRIRSRCCGLLELYRLPVQAERSLTSRPSDSALPAARVQYLHRSVAEFLYQGRVWSNLYRQRSSSKFDVHFALSHAYAAKLNRIKMKGQPLSSHDTSSYVQALLFCEQQFEKRTGYCQRAVVASCNRFMRTIWAGPTGLGVAEFWMRTNDSRQNIAAHFSSTKYAFVLAAFYGLLPYVRGELERQRLKELWPQHIPHLWPILLDYGPKHLQSDLETRCGIIDVLVDNGASLDTPFRGQSFWERFLLHCRAAAHQDIPSFSKILDKYKRRSLSTSNQSVSTSSDLTSLKLNLECTNVDTPQEANFASHMQTGQHRETAYAKRYRTESHTHSLETSSVSGVSMSLFSPKLDPSSVLDMEERSDLGTLPKISKSRHAARAPRASLPLWRRSQGALTSSTSQCLNTVSVAATRPRSHSDAILDLSGLEDSAEASCARVLGLSSQTLE